MFDIRDDGFCYSTWLNTDLTEGRGIDYPAYVSDWESTARRLGDFKNVQGSNGIIRKLSIFSVHIDGRWVKYGPVYLHSPTKEDRKRQVEIDYDNEKRDIIDALVADGKISEDIAKKLMGEKGS